MKPALKAPESQLLKLEHEKVLSNHAFKFNLRRYIKLYPPNAIMSAVQESVFLDPGRAPTLGPDPLNLLHTRFQEHDFSLSVGWCTLIPVLNIFVRLTLQVCRSSLYSKSPFGPPEGAQLKRP
jgi:hypothetical protein